MSKAAGEERPNAPLRIVNIIEEGRWGGPQHRIASVSRVLMELGIETTVILPQNDNDVFVQKLQASAIPHHSIKLHKLTRDKKGLLSFLFHFPGDVWRMRAAIKKSRAQLVHCNSAGQWKGQIAAKLAGVPAIWHLNDTHMPKAVKLVFKPLSRWTVTGFLLSADRVASYYLQDQFSNYPQFIARPPVDCDRFKPGNEAISEDEVIKVVSVGNINADKDTKTYVRAAQLLQTLLNDQVHCSQIGPEFETQKRYVASVRELNDRHEKPAVVLLGGQNDVRPFLDKSDIFVCSSRRESGPMSVFEAMAMGLPIVTTDVGDLAAMNGEGDFARIVPVGDHQALAREVATLVEAPDERHRLGANARQYAVENLDTRICARDHATAYRAILAI